MGKITIPTATFHVCDRCGVLHNKSIRHIPHTWVKFTRKDVNFEVVDLTAQDRKWLCPTCTLDFADFMKNLI